MNHITGFVMLIIALIVIAVLFILHRPHAKNPSKEMLSPNSELMKEFLTK